MCACTYIVRLWKTVRQKSTKTRPTKTTPSKPRKGKVKKASSHQEVKFCVQAPLKSKVFVAGSFNDWSPEAHRLRKNGGDTYAGKILLAPGRHEYKFVVNGEWKIDSENPAWVPNNQSTLNSVIEVPHTQSAAAAQN